MSVTVCELAECSRVLGWVVVVNDTCKGAVMDEASKVKKKKKRHSGNEQSDILDKIGRGKQSKKQGHSSKKLDSNAKRLQALKERETNTSIKQSLVSSALQNLDSKDQQKNPKHITFDDDEEGQESSEVNQTKHGGTGKVRCVTMVMCLMCYHGDVLPW